MQLTNAVAAAVNGGIARPATLLYHDGEPAKGTRVFSPETSEKMRRPLRLVVNEGTGSHAAAEGYLVGGKTGTAEKNDATGYTSKTLRSSFVGVFPMQAPRYAVFVLLDEPKGDKDTYGYATGGWVCAPVVSRVISRMAPLMGVPPVDEKAPEIERQMFIKVHEQEKTLASF